MQFQNEIVIIASVLVFFGGLVAFFRLFGKLGLYAWTVICTIAANIEVMILVHAFGMETTLGNVIFASTFLATDMMSEFYGRREAGRCVALGIASNVAFIAISQTWFLYVPSASDAMAGPIRAVFSNTPRVMLASLAAYAVCEFHDVWAYHRIWRYTERLTGSGRAYLWLRNNGSTLASQLINAVAFNILAFAGVWDAATLGQVIVLGYATFIATSLLDTPFLYLARRMVDRHPELGGMRAASGEGA